MDALTLADRVRRSQGRAAVVLGAWCDAYRPSDVTNPLQPQNRFMKLQAAFSAAEAEFARPAGYGQAVWWGLFDAAYTRPGDYLVRRESGPGAADGGVWFVAQQQPLLPVLCVRAARVVGFVRRAPSDGTSNSGVGAYGGFTVGSATALLSDYPASIMNAYGGGLDPTDPPGDAPPRSWEVLLPPVPGVVLQNGDLMNDDLGRTGVVASAELTDIGWRMLVKQTTTLAVVGDQEMADQSDVETVLTQLVSGVIYPRGANAPSILGVTCHIYRGWPNSAALNTDLAAKRVNITVFPDARQQLNTTRWTAEFMPAAPVAPTLTVSVSGNVATFTGSTGPGQLAGLLADKMAVVHRTKANDTPELVAAILASYLRTQRAAVLSGATVTVPGARLLIGRVVADQSFVEELRRQRQRFRITCWCPDPASRDTTSVAVDTALAAQPFIALPDGTQGRLRFASSAVFDQSQDAQLYRRDLVYSVDYSTTQVNQLPSMIFGDATLAPNGAGVVQSLLS